MKKNEFILLVILVFLIVISLFIALCQYSSESVAIVGLVLVSGLATLLVESVFYRIKKLHSRWCYYVALCIASGLGFGVFSMLAPYTWVSYWWAKIVFCLVASISISLNIMLLEKISKSSVVPWERKKH